MDAGDFPVTLFWVVGNWLILIKRHRSPWRMGELFLLVVFWTFFVLYSTVLGSAHLVRYTIFLIPLLVLTAARGAMWTWQNWPRVTRAGLYHSGARHLPCSQRS
jgi:hypothetical protein